MFGSVVVTVVGVAALELVVVPGTVAVVTSPVFGSVVVTVVGVAVVVVVVATGASPTTPSTPPTGAVLVVVPVVAVVVVSDPFGVAATSGVAPSTVLWPPGTAPAASLEPLVEVVSITWPSGVVVVPAAAASDSCVVTVLAALTVVVVSPPPQAASTKAAAASTPASRGFHRAALLRRAINERFPGDERADRKPSVTRSPEPGLEPSILPVMRALPQAAP